MLPQLRHFAIACILVTSGAVARGDVILTFDPVIINAARGSAAMNVFIESPNDTHDVAAYNFGFIIEKISGDGALVFDPAQSASELTDSRYLFANTSDLGNNFVSRRDSSAFAPQIQLTHVDLTDDRPAANLDSTRRLVGMLDVSHVYPSGDAFTSALFQIRAIEANTELFDGNLDPIPFSPVSFSNHGLVTVNASAVPEPSSLVLVGIFGATALLRRHRQWRFKGGSKICETNE